MRRRRVMRANGITMYQGPGGFTSVRRTARQQRLQTANFRFGASGRNGH